MTAPIMGNEDWDANESRQDVAELNAFTLIGCTDERGDAWHRRDDLMSNGNNHFPGLIPLSVVAERLFNWQPRQAKVGYLIPALPTDDPKVVVSLGGRAYRVVETQNDRVGVLRSDNDYDLGVFKSGATHPPYQVTLIQQAERLVGTTLGISSAGLLSKGGRAWVEFSMQETFMDPKSGFGYRPNLVHADSMDGTIAYTKALTVNATVCMNTLRRNLLEASSEGTIVRRKHTQGILDPRKDADERAALGILEQVQSEFEADLHKLISIPVSPQQRIEVMDIMAPLNPEGSDQAKRFWTNRRDQIEAMGTDPMVAPWIGTAFGEVQRYSTLQHWEVTPKGTGRWERNSWRDILGKSADADRAVVLALESVLA